MKPFTGIVYLHERTPKALKKSVHNKLFYNNKDCVKYEIFPGIVKALYKDAFAAAKILDSTKGGYLNLHLIPNKRYHRHILLIEEEMTADVNEIIQEFEGDILEESNTHTVVKFNKFLFSAKALQLLKEKQIIADFATKSEIKNLTEL